MLRNNFHSFFSVNEYTGLTEVGSIFGYKVFLDILMPPDQILLSIDKQSLRDYKIDPQKPSLSHLLCKGNSLHLIMVILRLLLLPIILGPIIFLKIPSFFSFYS